MSEYPLKRIATPEDIADIVCFLVSARGVHHRHLHHRGRWRDPRRFSLIFSLYRPS
jgi:hypothetical protein